MSAPTEPDPANELGPIDFLAIEFPGGNISAPGFEQLLSLADRASSTSWIWNSSQKIPRATPARSTSASSPTRAAST